MQHGNFKNLLHQTFIMKKKLSCRICSSTADHEVFIGREMMFGTREEFEYFQCAECECLQITTIPEDLSRFYPDQYYSFFTSPKDQRSRLIRFLIKQRFKNAIFDKGYKINKILSNFVSMPDLRVDEVLPIPTILRTAGISDFNARFLDIGCGSWSIWLEMLYTAGFKNLYGADPFIKKCINHNRITILNKELKDIKGNFDLITMHHSLEHIPNQQETLECAKNLLTPNGVILLRIPTVSSFAWHHYKTNWVEMDPPRHLYLHSKRSIELLGQLAGLQLYKTISDTLDFELYGSEQYCRDIPLTDKNSYWSNRNSTIFTSKELLDFKNMAKNINANNTAGRMCFFFKKR